MVNVVSKAEQTKLNALQKYFISQENLAQNEDENLFAKILNPMTYRHLFWKEKLIVIALRRFILKFEFVTSCLTLK